MKSKKVYKKRLALLICIMFSLTVLFGNASVSSATRLGFDNNDIDSIYDFD